MTDIVELLRTRNGNPSGFGLGPVCDEAADQIERLLAERERWAAVVSHTVRELTELDEATAQAQANALRELLTPSVGFKGHCPHTGE